MDDYSTSARTSGWHHYPGEVWDERKPITWLDDWPFWAYCIQHYATSEAPILELACGNGRITRQLALAGYTVTAVDLNPHFLSRASTYLPEHVRPNVNLMLQDVINLDLDQQFAIVLMTDWAFPAILTQDDQLRFFERLGRHLSPSGVFAFNTPLLGASPIVGQFDALSQTETKTSAENTIRLRHNTLSEILLLGKLTGFEIIEAYGGVDKRPLLGQVGDDLTLVMRYVG
ncbi:MAG: class I SAM-dependent methyltransferase [Anaerolineales bacterium]|nr:class I SAM-dependent methyltransferase [Anaerolineales bacterium]